MLPSCLELNFPLLLKFKILDRRYEAPYKLALTFHISFISSSTLSFTLIIYMYLFFCVFFFLKLCLTPTRLQDFCFLCSCSPKSLFTPSPLTVHNRMTVRHSINLMSVPFELKYKLDVPIIYFYCPLSLW